MPTPAVIIVAALVRRGDDLLLVEQQGPEDDAASWMLPAGRVEAGETLVSGLARELAEETGLRLTRTTSVAFAVELHIGNAAYSAVTFECEADGELAPDDPDGFIRSAEWVPTALAFERLRCVSWYDCEPLSRFLSGEARPGAMYVFEQP